MDPADPKAGMPQMGGFKMDSEIRCPVIQGGNTASSAPVTGWWPSLLTTHNRPASPRSSAWERTPVAAFDRIVIDP